MKYKHLFASALLCAFTMNGLFAQQQEEVHSARLYITYEDTENAKKRGQISLSGEEAYQFDVADFLAKNKYEAVRVHGKTTLQKEQITWHFDSEKTDEMPAFATFNPIITSMEKTPFLGVSVIGMDDFTGARVTAVTEDSAAAAYGFQVGDVITVINNYEISTACDLTMAIGETTPGDVAVVDFVRTNKSETLEVTLGYRLHKKMSWEATAGETAITFDHTDATPQIDLAVFPNPTSGLMQVNYAATEQTTVQLTVTDITGTLVFSQAIEAFDGFYNDVIDLKTLPDGVYFLNVIQGENVRTEKIVLQKTL